MNIGRCGQCLTMLRSEAPVVRCPRGCSQRVVLKPIQIVGDQAARCGARCRDAISSKCDCECGGVNHGQYAVRYVHDAYGNSQETWTGYVSNAEDVDRVVIGQMEGVVERAMAAGASAPLTYVGAGMTGVVLRSGPRSYKVARNLTPTRHSSFEAEAEFFQACSRVPEIREQVAQIRKFDPYRLVIIKRYVPRDPEAKAWKNETAIWELHKRIEATMIPHGWTAPEFKADSYVLSEAGPVLVDGTFAHRVGLVLLQYATDLLDERRPWWDETPRDLAFALRMEVGRTLTQDQIAPLEARLNER